MSVVSGIVLCASVDDEDNFSWTQIRNWLGERHYGDVMPVADRLGGEKHPQMVVAGAGYDDFPNDEFAVFVLSLPWVAPENLVLIIQPEDGPTKIYRGAS